MLIQLTDDVINNKDALYCVINILNSHKDNHSLTDDTLSKLNDKFESGSMEQKFYHTLYLSSINNIKYTFKINVVLDEEDLDKYNISYKNLNAALSVKSLVLVEHEINDKAFVMMLLNIIGKRKIVEQLYCSWDFSHSGGCGYMPDKIDLEINQKKYTRMCVIVDSDKYYENQGLEKNKLNIIKKGKECNVIVNVLKKREAENYIPDDIFSKFQNPAYRENFDKISTLSQEQKDYLDYKYGFHGKGKSYDNIAYNGLFSDISKEAMSFNGFTDKILSTCFSENLNLITKESFVGGVIEEFTSIANSIEMIL
ncbi:TPA: hypothetical protein ACVU4Y_004522 [Vibrio parahaemolyticus]